MQEVPFSGRFMGVGEQAGVFRQVVVSGFFPREERGPGGKSAVGMIGVQTKRGGRR